MKRIHFLLSLFLIVGFISLGTVTVRSFETSIEKVSVQYGNGRPFSFYYPYNYQYYNPRPRLDGNTTSYGGSRSCYWLYTNGTYVYYCN